VTVCDFSPNMLRVGQQRSDQLGYSKRARIEWVEGDAQQLPFADNSFDAYTIAFGIRNVIDVQKALTEAHRVLKPGGVFTCLEFSKMQNPLLEG
jgi:ubiquinone/menaquinone biosynthesis C-methylase UbiE